MLPSILTRRKHLLIQIEQWKHTRTKCKINLKLTIKTLERLQCRSSGVYFVDSENTSHLFLVLNVHLFTECFPIFDRNLQRYGIPRINFLQPLACSVFVMLYDLLCLCTF